MVSRPMLARRPSRRHTGQAPARPRLGRVAPLVAPAVAAILGVIGYTLSGIGAVSTQLTLGVSACLLILLVLYFPLRYYRRLHGGQRAAAVVFAVLWALAIGTPIYLRLVPPPRLATLEVRASALPVPIPPGAQNRRLDLEVIGHLRPGVPGATRAAGWDLILQDPQAAPLTLEGRFFESWDSRPGADGKPVVRSRRTTQRERIGPLGPRATISSFRVHGQAEPILTLGLRPDPQPGWLLVAPAACLLLLGAARYDRQTGAGRTAASLTIATGAALTGALAFPWMGSVDATFRDLLGAVVIGALLGGPIGGAAAWALGATRGQNGGKTR